MRLSRESRYALEALSVLARRPAGGVVEARALADETGIPPFFLAKIMQTLARARVVQSFRGKGYALFDPPEIILVRDIIAGVDESNAFWEGCIFWREECSDADPCPLHFRWQEMRPRFNEGIGDVTLADIRDSRMAPVRDE